MYSVAANTEKSDDGTLKIAEKYMIDNEYECKRIFHIPGDQGRNR